MQTSEQTTDAVESQINVGQTERWISGIAGATLLSLSLVRRSLIFAVAGSALMSRAVTGHSVLYARLGMDTAHRQRATREQRDTVDEASWESFPASDPPAYTDTGVGGPH